MEVGVGQDQTSYFQLKMAMGSLQQILMGGIREQEGVLEFLDHWEQILDLMKMGVIAKRVVWPLGTKMDCSRDKRENKMPCRISVTLVFLKLLIWPYSRSQTLSGLEMGE